MKLTSGQDDLVMITRVGMSIRFHEDDLRDLGRATYGVKGITLREDTGITSSRWKSLPRTKRSSLPE